jgi:hypothetical protein
MTTLDSTKSDPEQPEQGLDRRYGEIGIPAVVAALRYRPETKNQHALRDERYRIAALG